jgi:hypothetical protein
VINILYYLLTYDGLDIEKFMIRDGMVMFFMHVIFDKNRSKKLKLEATKLLKMKLELV